MTTARRRVKASPISPIRRPPQTPAQARNEFHHEGLPGRALCASAAIYGGRWVKVWQAATWPPQTPAQARNGVAVGILARWALMHVSGPSWWVQVAAVTAVAFPSIRGPSHPSIRQRLNRVMHLGKVMHPPVRDWVADACTGTKLTHSRPARDFRFRGLNGHQKRGPMVLRRKT